ncbi:MAG: hypothetical protein WCY93_06390 [Anaerolineaceae bacterium]
MTRKSLGFVPLIWQCAFCDTQNPGPIKSCTNCGAPQPENVEFLQVDEARFNFIKDEALIRMAKSGPDIHCPFCGTRNLATNDICTNCGGDLGWGGKERQVGQRVRSVTEAQAPPQIDDSTAKKRKAPTLAIILIILALIVGCVVLLVMLLRTDDVTATVTDVLWERSINVEVYTSITETAWRDEVPIGAQVTYCSSTYRYTSNTYVSGSVEVCGDPYVEDTGTGVGEVVQDCSYEVYDDYCEYTAMAWVVVRTVTESGYDLSPFWPAVNLHLGEREGEHSESYMINFSDGSDTYRFTTANAQLFSQAEIGSRWILQINQLGGVQSLEPIN